jgi:prepilin peptidase CpaA
MKSRTMSTDLPMIAAAFALVLLVGAALHDIATRTVPNCVPAGIVAAGIALRLLAGDLAFGLVTAFAVFAAATVLWLRGLMGGADAKLLGAAALTASPVGIPTLLLSTALFGGVLALIYLISSRFVTAPAPGRRMTLVGRFAKAERRRLQRRGPLPYATAIACGGVLTLTPILLG